MEKRYQVFISSTFQDLQGARQEVSQALLRADCFPAGMELFPAADEEQFEFIKTVIDQSDYYIIISAGRYGSIHPETGLSYTEMEYDYAVETGKPVIRLLHKDPFNELKGEFIEQTDQQKEALRNFRKKMSATRLVRFWEFPKELGVEVMVTLTDLRKRNTAIGWVKADSVLDQSASIELLSLRSKVVELEALHKPTDTFVTGDKKAQKIKAFIDETWGGSIAHKAVRVSYFKLLENLSRQDWCFDGMSNVETELAEHFLPVLLAVGSLSSKDSYLAINDRSYADYGYVFT